MFKAYDRTQEMLLPHSVQDFVSEEDLVVFVAHVVEHMDTSALTRKYHSLGQNGYHPNILLTLLYYAYATGITSSRKIAELTRYDMRYIYAACKQTPDHRTISDFRKNNIKILIDYFTTITTLGIDLGMASLESISIDGSKMKASASKKRNMKRDDLKAQAVKIKAHMTRLLQYAEEVDKADQDTPPLTPANKQLTELKDRLTCIEKALSQIEGTTQTSFNFTDPGCRWQNKIGPGYNVQLAVDRDHLLIVGQDVVTDINDIQLLPHMIDKLETTTSSWNVPKQILADSGYASIDTCRFLESHPHINGYIPSRELVNRQNGSISPYNKYYFNCNLDTRTCTCPLGKPMRFDKHDTNKQGEPIARFVGTQCSTCPRKGDCTKAS